ncbi:MAG: recombinase RecT [Proteobacteria bacterium]|nr:recombinase RecT [Pseudomonadota bacterium]
MNTTHAPARRDLNSLLERVDAARDQLEAYLPKGVKVERFTALARRAIAEQPAVAECSVTSVMRALSRCAEPGLPLDGLFSSLIVYKSRNGRSTARWDPSYRGTISLAMSSGFVTDVQSFAVTEHDEFTLSWEASQR